MISVIKTRQGHLVTTAIILKLTVVITAKIRTMTVVIRAEIITIIQVISPIKYNEASNNSLHTCDQGRVITKSSV